MVALCARMSFTTIVSRLFGGFCSIAILVVGNPAVWAETAESVVQTPHAISGGLFILGDSLYVAAWGYGLQVLDISRPMQPRWEGAWTQGGAPPAVYVVGTNA